MAIDTAWHPLVDGHPPEWAVGWGQDRRGVFVDFAVDVVTQRLRWIPPGRFLMGSPETEPGRVEGEGPQHRGPSAAASGRSIRPARRCCGRP